jgi:hypothetical protein
MTTLILLLFLLTICAHQNASAGALERARRNTRATLGAVFAQSRRNAALGLMVLTFVAVHVAHDVRTPGDILAAGTQDEIAWVAGVEAI